MCYHVKYPKTAYHSRHSHSNQTSPDDIWIISPSLVRFQFPKPGLTIGYMYSLPQE